MRQIFSTTGSILNAMALPLATAALLAACGSATPSPTPKLETAACRFGLPTDQQEGQTVSCGFVIVPENRISGKTRQIRLHVAVFKHTGPQAEPDPIFLLQGGPGETSQSIVSALTGPIKALLQTNRDLVVIEQRGVGASEPRLNCAPELTASGGLELLRPREERSQRKANGYVACLERLRSQRADLNAYSTRENADDVNAVRQALGFSKINLVGFSYGTRLALEMERRYPQTLRAVVLDSVIPPSVPLDYLPTATADAAFTALITNCVREVACNAAYPNLEAAFSRMASQLNQKPITVTVPTAGGMSNALLDGSALVDVVVGALYNRDQAAQLPKFLTELDQGKDLTALKPLARLLGDPALAERGDGLYIAIGCSEGLPFTRPASGARPEMVRDGYTELPQPLWARVCQASGVQASAALEAVSSDVPTLVQSGEFDPVTPPIYGRLAVSTLSRGFVFEYAGSGHLTWVQTDGCALGMAAQFLANPGQQPDSSCMTGLGLRFE